MHPYDSILTLPHHVSTRRHGMSRRDRAAQFAPFAALSGHDAALQETARLTEFPAELDEHRKADLNLQLHQLLQLAHRSPPITVTYFLPDSRKDGGRYAAVSGLLKKIDPFSGSLCLMDGTTIPIERIYALELLTDWNEEQPSAFSV